MRNMVEHGQISGSSDSTRQLRVLGGQPLHQVDLGGDGQSACPAGARSTALMM